MSTTQLDELLQSLVDSWDTFMVPTASRGGEERPASAASTDAEPQLSVFYNYLREHVDGSDLNWQLQHIASTSYDVFADSKGDGVNPSRNLWLLSLVSHNRELMRAAARLFLQFNQQFACAVEDDRRAVANLQEHQERELASLLNADAEEVSDLIVSSSVTECVVLRHQEEVERMLMSATTRERALELKLQSDFFSILSTSAPDALAALVADGVAAATNQAERRQATDKSQSSAGVSPSTASPIAGAADSRSHDASEGPALYQPEVDMSRFACVLAKTPQPAKRGSPGRTDATARSGPASAAAVVPPATVPVRTLTLMEPTAKSSAGVSRRPGDKKPSTAGAVVVDVSPTSCVRECLFCCVAPSSPLAELAAEEHLMRLAHARHGMLLLIGPRRAAMELLKSFPTPELFLGGGGEQSQCSAACLDAPFAPLPGQPALHVLFTTRFWGANIILLWDTKEAPQAGGVEVQAGKKERSAERFSSGTGPTNSSTAGIQQTKLDTTSKVILEDVLHLAFAWNVDMLSIALLESAKLPDVADNAQAGQTATSELLALQSMQLLRSVQAAMSSIMTEYTPSRTPQLWTVQDEELLAHRFWAESSSPTSPRAFGVRYVGRGSTQAACSPSPPSTQEAPSRRKGHKPSSIPTAASVPPAPSASVSPPHVYFNTHVAIRVFLPLPPSAFTADKYVSAAASEPSQRVGSNSAAPLQTPPRPSPSTVRDDGGRHGAFAVVNTTPRRGATRVEPYTPPSAQRVSPVALSPDPFGPDTFGSSFVTDFRERSSCARRGTLSLQQALHDTFGTSASMF